MNISKILMTIGLSLGLNFFVFQNILSAENSLQLKTQNTICSEIISSSDGDSIKSAISSLSEETRSIMVDKIKFAIVQENRNDLKVFLPQIEQLLRTSPQLSRENIMGIPLRPGKLKASVLFISKTASILRCDNSVIEIIIDQLRITIKAIPGSSNRATAEFSGKSPVGETPKEPMVGTITVSGNTATVNSDDGRWLKLDYKGEGTYKFSSSINSATITAKYID
ncbi:MAG: hypothetical protein HQM10_21820 [Candidatus Riflebacteria bacterium]|nr:hypothetical protein [Candidatus Riflebacteria bacterium]